MPLPFTTTFHLKAHSSQRGGSQVATKAPILPMRTLGFGSYLVAEPTAEPVSPHPTLGPVPTLLLARRKARLWGLTESVLMSTVTWLLSFSVPLSSSTCTSRTGKGREVLIPIPDFFLIIKKKKRKRKTEHFFE